MQYNTLFVAGRVGLEPTSFRLTGEGFNISTTYHCFVTMEGFEPPFDIISSPFTDKGLEVPLGYMAKLESDRNLKAYVGLFVTYHP